MSFKRDHTLCLEIAECLGDAWALKALKTVPVEAPSTSARFFVQTYIQKGPEMQFKKDHAKALAHAHSVGNDYVAGLLEAINLKKPTEAEKQFVAVYLLTHAL